MCSWQSVPTHTSHGVVTHVFSHLRHTLNVAAWHLPLPRESSAAPTDAGSAAAHGEISAASSSPPCFAASTAIAMVPCGHNVVLRMPDAGAMDIEEEDADLADGDDGSEADERGADDGGGAGTVGGGPRGKRKAKDDGGAASNKVLKRKASLAATTKVATASAPLPEWTARWVPWASLATLGLTLASQKVRCGHQGLCNCISCTHPHAYFFSFSPYFFLSSFIFLLPTRFYICLYTRSLLMGHFSGFGANYGEAMAAKARHGGSNR
jgi:hypothetical protein